MHFHLQTSPISSIREKSASHCSSVWLLVGSVSTGGAINEFLIRVFFGCGMSCFYITVRLDMVNTYCVSENNMGLMNEY